MRLSLATAVGLALFCGAAAQAARPPKKPAPAAAAPVALPTEDLSKSDTAALLERAGKHFRDQDYDKVLPLVEAALARPDVSVDQRLDAYLMQGSSLAIIGDAVEAEKPFRFLLRGRPDFDLSADTAPKILAIFRKVQVEEKAIASQMKELEHNRIVKELQLLGVPPAQAQGGLPITFTYQLRDPRGLVTQVQLLYRRAGEEAFAALPLKHDPRGDWSGAIPGEWTASPTPYSLEYFVTSADVAGERLIALASATSPLALPVDAGKVPEQKPLYKNGWLWGGVALVAVALGTATYFVVQKAGQTSEPSVPFGVQVHLPGE